MRGKKEVEDEDRSQFVMFFTVSGAFYLIGGLPMMGRGMMIRTRVRRYYDVIVPLRVAGATHPGPRKSKDSSQFTSPPKRA
jgi:hypothetical protein